MQINWLNIFLMLIYIELTVWKTHKNIGFPCFILNIISHPNILLFDLYLSSVVHVFVCVDDPGSSSGITLVLQLIGKEGVSITSRCSRMPFLRISVSHSQNVCPELLLLLCAFFSYSHYVLDVLRCVPSWRTRSILSHRSWRLAKNITIVPNLLMLVWRAWVPVKSDERLVV